VNLSDRAVSYLRTVVPVLWGSLIGLLVQSVTWLPAPVIAWLSGEAAVGVVTAGAIAAWYAVWRWAEPRIPDWLTRVVLGSALTPAYDQRTDHDPADRVWSCPVCQATYSTPERARRCAVEDADDD
jgi:hypothetical protein